jgi:uncharacterized Zn finger protein
MNTRKRNKNTAAPLIIEEHPTDYTGYPFITLIQYRHNHTLCIVDNNDEKIIKCYVLDLCGAEQVDEAKVIEIANVWYNESRHIPLSIEFARLGMTAMTKKIYRSFNTEYVTRVIGPLPTFQMNEVHSIKRRRKKEVPVGLMPNTNVYLLR